MRPLLVALPRKVALYYLLFSLFAMACFACGLVLVVHSVASTGVDGQGLRYLGFGTEAMSLAYARDGEAGLPRALLRVRDQHNLLDCAIVGDDGRYLAHTNRRLRGQVELQPAGDRQQWGELERVRYFDGKGRRVRQYETPLRAGDQHLGRLVLALQEPGLSQSMQLALFRAPLPILLSLSLIGIGTVVVSRLVWPVAEVDQQLRTLARAASPDDVQLQPVTIRGGGSLGWNRLVEERLNSGSTSELEDRLAAAVSTQEHQKGEDVLHSIVDGVAVTDAAGKVEFANRALAALLGYGNDFDKLKGTSAASLTGTFSLPEDSPLLDPELLSRPVVAELERGENKDLHVLRVARSPLRTASGASGHVWSFRDISQQRLAEQMRDQFLDSATHELRTPLANIKAYAETLALSEMMDVEQQKEFCNTINSEATRLARFIDDLLSVSSMEVGSLSVTQQEVDVQRLLQEVIQNVRPQMDQKSIAFNSALPAKLPKLHVDKDKIAAALINLLGNAAKYTPDGGNVTLRARVVENRLQIAIEDSGLGIAEDELSRVFDKFFRSGDTRVQEQTGTGLGLSFTQEVIRLHDGTLEVESKLNEGSTFTMTLPIRKPGG